MKKSSFLAVGVLAGLALLLGWVMATQSGSDSAEAAKRTKTAGRDAGITLPRLPSESVLAIGPGARKTSAPTKAAIPPLTQEFLDAREYKPIYDRLKSLSRRTPEEDRILGEVLQRCAKLKENPRKPQGPQYKVGGEESRRRFLAAISEKDPARDKRIAAFEKVSGNVCEDLLNLEVSEQEILALFKSATNGGDPIARVRQVEWEINAAARGADGQMDWPRRTISDAQVDSLKQGVASSDPLAFAAAARSLMSPYQNLSLRVGPHELPLEMQAFSGAITLLACDLGQDCTAGSRQLLQACAHRGQCDAVDYRDILFFYEQSPYRSQLINEYYLGLQRARAGDWSYFTFHRGPSPSLAPLLPIK